MYVLVTGANGTVGRVLCDVLTLAGHEVTRSDMAMCDDADYKPMDILYPDSVYDTIRPGCYEVVVNLAGQMGILNGEKMPHRMLETNILGTLNVANACSRTGMHLIHVSSSDVYGALFDEGFVCEEMEIPISATKNIYALSKLVSEQVVTHYVEENLLKATIVRPVMLYGPGELVTRYRSALVRLARAEIEGDQFFIHRGARRGWCHYEDFSRAIVAILGAIEKKDPLPPIIDVGNDDYRTIAELDDIIRAVLVSMELKPKGIIVDQQGSSHEKRLRSMDKTFAFNHIRALGWKPVMPLEVGVREVIKGMVE